MKVLVTRPEPGASATAARLAQMGFEPLLAPCLTITKLPARLPENPAALIITSGQAVQALPESLHLTPVFCVGDATAARLRQAGFAHVRSAGGDAQDLFRLILASRLPGTYVLASGERQGMALARQLTQAGIAVLRRKVYAARPIRALPAAALDALHGAQISAALFYSAETARSFVRLNPPNTKTVRACALSAAAAQPLHGLPWSEIRAALAPTEADLMACLT